MPAVNFSGALISTKFAEAPIGARPFLGKRYLGCLCRFEFEKLLSGLPSPPHECAETSIETESDAG
jgi:hypothetical protein